jgi:hypothetical protein
MAKTVFEGAAGTGSAGALEIGYCWITEGQKPDMGQ